jgi:predicted nucleic acid-binding protein
LTVKTDNPAVLVGAEQLLLRYSDQKLSYVDAISMTVMREEKISQVFGFDRHFHLLNFELVPE